MRWPQHREPIARGIEESRHRPPQGGYGGAVVGVFGPLPDCLNEARTPRTPAVQAAAR
jgi:hypothetical protein